MIVNIENLSIGDIFSGRNPFIVEKYQRDYSWEVEEIDDFVKDIMYLYSTYPLPAENPREKRHFFGGLVSISKQVPQTATGRIFEVVDGQQRLATFLISIAHVSKALLDLANQSRRIDVAIESASKNYAQQIDEDFIHYREVVGPQRVPKVRLQLSKPDQIFFDNLINGRLIETTRESHKRLLNASNQVQTDLINKIISDPTLVNEEKMNNLLKMLSCLIDNCHVIHIVSDEKKDAYRLFTILNDRGRALSDGDLLRSFTLELLESNAIEQNQVEEYWNEILKREKEKIDTFLRNYFGSHSGNRPVKRDLHDQYQNTFFNGLIPPLSEENIRVVERRVNNILIESNFHKQLSEGKWPFEDSHISDWDKNRLDLLINVQKHTLSLPLLVSARSCLTEEKFSQIVNAIDRIVFRYIIIVRGHPAKLEKIYLKNALKIRQNPQTYQIPELIQDLKQLILSDAQDLTFENGLKELKYTKKGSQQNRLIKYFLITIEDHYRWFNSGAAGRPIPDRERVFDFDELSIEHIYAQNARTRIPNLEPVVNDLGNLTFWGPDDNQSAGNDTFAQKKIKYRQSAISITRELSTLREWNKNKLDARKKLLVKMAKKIFIV